MIRKIMATGLMVASMTSGAAFAATSTTTQSQPARPTQAQMQEHFQHHFKPLLDSWNLSASDESAVWKAEQSFHESLPKPPKHVKGQKPAKMTDAQRNQLREAFNTRKEALAKILNQKQLKAWFVVTRPPMHRPGMMHHPMHKAEK